MRNFWRRRTMHSIVFILIRNKAIGELKTKVLQLG